MGRLRSRLQPVLHDLTARAASRLASAPGGLRSFLSLLRLCAVRLHRNRALQISAELTYHTLFSLIPALIVALMILHALTGASYSERFRNLAVDRLLPESGLEAAIENSEDVEPSRRAQFADARRVLRNQLDELLAEIADLDLKRIGFFGTATFLIGALGLFATIERTFNRIYGSPSRRRWSVRLPLQLAALGIGPLVLIGGQLAGDFALSHLASVPIRESWVAVLPRILASWLIVYALYRLAPSTKVDPLSAGVGSLVSTLFWYGGRSLYSFYVSRTLLTSLYGALALIPLTLAWLFLSWLIVLFGLELTYSLQYHRGDPALVEAELARTAARTTDDD